MQTTNTVSSRCQYCGGNMLSEIDDSGRGLILKCLQCGRPPKLVGSKPPDTLYKGCSMSREVER